MNTQTVIWTEGQLLTQQHLQWHDHWHALRAAQHWKAVNPHTFGWLSLIWDTQVLYQQCVQLTQFQLIFPNGEYYEYHVDAEVSPIAFDLSGVSSPACFYLCLPTTYSVTQIPGYPEVGCEAQWTAQCQLQPDRLDTQRSHELLIGRPNWQLSLEPLADCHVLPAMRCEKNPTNGQWQIDETYFYPVLALEACPALKINLQTLIQRIEQYTEQPTSGLNLTQKAWVASTLYELRHGFLQDYSLERLYVALAKLLISLEFPNNSTTFLYNCYQFHQSWQTLLNAWARYLQQPAQQWNACLPLQQQSKVRWQIESIPSEAFERPVWILVVETAQPLGEQLAKRFREETKIAAKGQVDRFAALALNGLTLEALLRPAPAFYQRYRGDYFQLLQEGSVWESICKERSLGVLLSAPFQELSLKLLVTHQDEGVV